MPHMPYFVDLETVLELAKAAQAEAQILFDAAEAKAAAQIAREKDPEQWVDFYERWTIGDTRTNLAAWNRIVERLERDDFTHHRNRDEIGVVVSEHSRRKSDAFGTGDEQLNELKNAAYALTVLFGW